MEIITSHTVLDFDGLASMVAAGKLYPAAVKVFCGTLSKNVKNFMALYKDSVLIKNYREIDPSQVTRMIVVDTANRHRLGQFQALAERPGMEFHVYDHHPASEGDVPARLRDVHRVGATTTIMVERLKEKGLAINAFDATILALGIYEDTGSLLFSTTTARDAYAAAYLLECGANLSVVNTFIEHSFSGEQVHLLQEFLESAMTHRINNIDVVVAVAEVPHFIPGMDLVTHRLFEMKNSDVVFTVARMDDRIHVVARSRVPNAKVNEVLKPLGGSGHERAAAAVVRGETVVVVVERIIHNLQEWIHPPLRARDIMSSPVKTVPSSMSMEEAGRLMLRYGHTGMPVVDEGRLTGVISRRDVDKAALHNLGHAPVKGFMTTNVMWVSPDTSITEVQSLMVENDVGRLPVIKDDVLIGIVSRTDILRTLHGQDYPEDHALLFQKDDDISKNLGLMVNKRLPEAVVDILQKAGECGEELDYQVYCVGGFVRDLLLKVPNFDVDLVVEGDGTVLARALGEAWGARVRIHDRFKTAVIMMDDSYKIDVATARTEYYEYPAALPMVSDSSIKEDMFRRDFTINTLAICLNPDRFGELIDYYGGRRDIEQKVIRILYNFSFVEDPTRIMRAIRFEQRYDMMIEPDTLRFAIDAVERRLLGKLSFKRILNEMILILNEKNPLPAMNRMQEIGVWEYILPEVALNAMSIDTFKRVPAVIGWWQERYYTVDLKPWLVYFMIILAQVGGVDREKILKRCPFENYARRCLETAPGIPYCAAELSGQALKLSEIHELIGTLTHDQIIYLLLCIRDSRTWDRIVEYLDQRTEVLVEANGNDFIAMDLKPGPVFTSLKEALFRAHLDGLAPGKDGELAQVRQWVDQGLYNDDNDH